MTDYSIWPSTDGPLTDFADGPYNLSTQFRPSANAWLKAIRFWRGTTNIVGPILGRLWRVTGPGTGDPVPNTDVTFSLSGVGWQLAATPLFPQLTPGQDYRVAITVPSNYSATGGYWTSGPGAGGITNALFTAPDSPGAGGQGQFVQNPAYTYPNQTFGGGNYWVDIVLSDVLPLPVGGNMSISDTARINMIAQLGLTDPQARVLTNVDLMKRVLEFGGQTLVTKTDATAAIHLERYLRSLKP